MESIGPYELRAELGRGGMGVVYRAFHPALDREFALKVIRPDILAGDSGDLVARFRREAQAAARLADHPGVVGVRDIGEDAGRLYLAMDLVPGRALDELIADGDVGVSLAMQVVEQAARAVHAAHEAGILHRDLKPANILVADGGEAYVTDFGLAGLTRLEADAQRLTASNMLVGTPSYMAPEQAGTGAVDGTADVWALGVTLYEALSNRLPFEGDSTLAVLTKLLHEPPPLLRSVMPEVPAAIEAIVMKCLERDPVDRYPTALALAEDCGRWRRGEAPHARPSGAFGSIGRGTKRHQRVVVAAAVLGCSAVAIGAAWWGMGEQQRTGEAGVTRESDEARAVEALAARADAFREIEAATRAHFAVLEDRAQQGTRFSGKDAEARSAIDAILDGRADRERGTTAHHAWRAYTQVLSGEASSVVLREIADGDPDDPVVRVLLARVSLLHYANGLKLPGAVFASTDRAEESVIAADTESARAVRLAGVRAIAEASRTALWPQIAHGPEAMGMLAALEAMPHSDWPTVRAGLAPALDDPWWRAIAEQLTGFALAAEGRFDEAADVLGALARRRRWAGLLFAAGDLRLDAARKAQNTRQPSEALFAESVATLRDAVAWAPESAEAAMLLATSRLELAVVHAEQGADPEPALQSVLAELDAARERVGAPDELLLVTARVWLVRAQAGMTRGRDPVVAARACIAAAEAFEATASVPERVSFLYRANANSAIASWQTASGGDAANALLEAQRALDGALTLNSDDGVALNDRGTVRLQLAMYHAVRGRNPLEQLADAEDDFRRAATLLPKWIAPVANSTDVHLLRAQWLEATGQDSLPSYRAAERFVSAAIAAEPGQPTYRSRRGMIRRFVAQRLSERGESSAALRAEAQADFEAALELQPLFPEAQQGLAELLVHEAKVRFAAGEQPTALLDRAIDHLERVWKAQPRALVAVGALARAHLLRARVRHAGGEDPDRDEQAALAYFDRRVRATPTRAAPLYERSYVHFVRADRAQRSGAPMQAHLQACLADVDRALDLNARFAPAQYRRGLCLKGLGRLPEAIAAIEAVLVIDPDHPQAADALAEARRELAGQRDK